MLHSIQTISPPMKGEYVSRSFRGVANRRLLLSVPALRHHPKLQHYLFHRPHYITCHPVPYAIYGSCGYYAKRIDTNNRPPLPVLSPLGFKHHGIIELRMLYTEILSTTKTHIFIFTKPQLCNSAHLYDIYIYT